MKAVWFPLVLLIAACVQTAPPPSAEPGPPAVVDPPRNKPSTSSEKLADGRSCERGDQCLSGTCEGEGCGVQAGTCVSRERMCTMDRVPYCGCDGKTFFSSSGCPSRLYQRRGECEGEASAKRPDGGACSQPDDCQSGICEGLGCGRGEGVCASARRNCTSDLVDYCGCDGSVFQSSSTCPGRRFASRGKCEAVAKEAGASCDRNDECASAVCEGEGCGKGQGVCASKRRICTRDLRAYCGCDGVTFRASGSCPGKRYQYRGTCQSR